MILSFFSRRPDGRASTLSPVSGDSTGGAKAEGIGSPSAAARTLAKVGHERQRALYRETARAIAAASGQPIPAALEA